MGASDMLAAALVYGTRYGWPVLPLHTPRLVDVERGVVACSCAKGPTCRDNSKGKHPRTPNGLDDASADEAQIREWWTRWPDANIGVITGERSGLYVVDVDGVEGEEALRTMLGDEVPPTPTVLTGKGRHLWFQRPAIALPNRGRMAPEIDTRGDGGYVIAPPSLHYSGRRYRWDDARGLLPKYVDPAPLPAPLLAAAQLGCVDKTGRPVDKPPAAAIAFGPIADGERNQRLTEYAGRLFAKGHGEREVLELLRSMNQTHCRPPLGDDEVVGIVANIAQREARKPVRPFDPLVSRIATAKASLPDPVALAQAQAEEAVATARRDYSNAPQFPWPSLADLVGPVLPGDLWILGARTGNGKTTTLINWIDALARSGTGFIYAGMERRASELRRMWAAWHCGYSVRNVLENKWGVLPPAAPDLLDDHIRWQTAPERASLAQFAPIERFTVAEMSAWVEQAVRYACKVVIVDHFHRMSFEGEEQLHAKSEAVRFAKMLAVKHDVSIVLAAQLNRGGNPSDPLLPYYPPALTALKDCGTLEEEADRVVMLHRCLRSGIKKGDLAEVREGQRSIETVALPFTIGFTCRKHRTDGNASDRTVKLSIVADRITEPKPELLSTTESRHGLSGRAA